MGSIVAIASAVWSTTLGKILAGVAAFLIAWKVNNYVVAQNTTKKIVRASKIEGKKRNARASEIRQKTRQPGAADRLRRDACRDCERLR